MITMSRCQRQSGSGLAGALAKAWIEENSLACATLPVDYHVKVHSDRKSNLPKYFIARQKLCLPPLEKPVIEQKTHNWFGDDMKKISIFSSTASRRQVIVKFPDNQICAEAPPDVAETILSSLELLIKKRAKDDSAESYDADFELNKTLLTIADRLFERTQGAQFFRDGAFHLCLTRINGAIKDNEFRKIYEGLFEDLRHSLLLVRLLGSVHMT